MYECTQEFQRASSRLRAFPVAAAAAGTYYTSTCLQLAAPSEPLPSNNNINLAAHIPLAILEQTLSIYEWYYGIGSSNDYS